MKEQKTLIINTMSESTYRNNIHKLPSNQLHIVDDADKKARTVLASYDLLTEKITILSNDVSSAFNSLRLGYDPEMCTINLFGSNDQKITELDARPLISDNYLSAAELTNGKLLLHVARYISSCLSIAFDDEGKELLDDEGNIISNEITNIISVQTVSVDFPLAYDWNDGTAENLSCVPYTSNTVYAKVTSVISNITDISTAIALSVDTMSSHIALSVDDLEVKTNDMSTAIALSVDDLEVKTNDMSNAIALSVDDLEVKTNDMSNAIALSVDDLETKTNDMSTAIALSIDTMSSHIALSVDDLETKTNDMSTAIALSIDTMSSHIALSVDQLSNYIIGLNSQYKTPQYQIFSAIGQINGKLCADFTQLDLNAISGMDELLLSVIGNRSNIKSLTKELIDEKEIRSKSDGYLSGAIDAINRTAIPTALSSANTYTDYRIQFLSLTTPNKENKLITQADIAKFDQIMHFVDTIAESEPKPLSSNTYTAWDDKKYKIGDVIVSTKSGQEFVFLSSNTAGGTKYWWEVIGDQNTYLGKATFESFTDDINEKITNILTAIALSVDTMSSHIALSVDDLETKTNDMSNAIALSIDTMSSHIALSIDTMSSHIALSVDDLETKTNDMSTAIALSVDTMSSHITQSITELVYDIDNKVKVGDFNHELSAVDELSVVHIDADEYYRMVAGISENAIDPTMIYVVSSETTNVYNERITNVADPIDKLDAVNLRTMEAAIQSTSSSLDTKINDLNFEIHDIDPDTTLKFIRQDNGLISAETQKIIIKQDQIEDLSGKTFIETKYAEELTDENDKLIRNSTVDRKIADSVNSLSVEVITSDISATLTSLSEVNGIISGKYAPIQIAETQVLNLNNDISNLSNAISSKVKVGDFNHELSAVDELSVVHIDADEYYRMVKLRQLDPTTIYILSSEYFNAYGYQIRNLGAPKSSSDAVNLSTITILSNDLTGKIDTGINTFAQSLYDRIHPVLSNAITEGLDFEALSGAVMEIYSALSEYVKN